MLVIGLGAAGIAVSKILLARRACTRSSAATRAASLHGSARTTWTASMTGDQALVRRGDQPRAAARARRPT